MVVGAPVGALRRKAAGKLLLHDLGMELRRLQDADRQEDHAKPGLAVPPSPWVQGT